MPKHREQAGDIEVASKLLRLAVETAPDAMILAREDGSIYFANRQAAQLFGYEPEEFIDLTIEELVPSQKRKKHARHRKTYLANPSVRAMGATDMDLELYGLRKDGTEFPAEISLGYLKTEEGLIAAAAVRDIRKRRRSEEAQVLNDYLDAILLNLPVGIAILEGPDFRYFRINKVLADLNGKTIEDHLGKTLKEVLPDSSSIVANLQKVRSEGTPILDREFSIRLPSDPDEELHLMDFHFPITVKGKVRAVGAVVLDITARKRAEEELQKAHDELESRVAERTAELEAANSRLRRLEASLRQLTKKLEVENIYLREELETFTEPEDMVGKSDLWRQVLYLTEKVANTDATVLFLGETGTGKCVLAHHLHRQSARADHAFVKINCAVLPASLIESELFGHDKGAFTGATTTKAGRFEIADGGTVFLDEIGELPLELQPKLLRVLNDGEFERVGSTKTRKTDVRVVAATNRKLQEALAEGTFREDLYYRLSVFPVELPPLRKRSGDIPLFVWYFLREFRARHGKEITAVSRKTMAALRSYSWPGNVRELKNVVERAVILSPASELMLAPGFTLASTATSAKSSAELEDVAHAHILQVVEECDWKIRGKGNAAERLGINHSTLRSRMKKLGIERPRTKAR